MKSQRERILDYLLKGHKLTPMRSLYLFDCFRTASRIRELRKAGHNIRTDLVTVGKRTFASYSLNK